MTIVENFKEKLLPGRCSRKKTCHVSKSSIRYAPSFLMAGYPEFHPQDCSKDTMSSEGEAGLQCIVPARRFSAISVWHPRNDPTQRLTSRLKRFNTAFLNLNDSTSFIDGNVLTVLMLTPTFLSPLLRDQVLSSWDKFLSIIDDLHQGRLDVANHTLYHVSRVGLLKTVVAEVFAIRGINGELLEFITVETLVDHGTIPQKRTNFQGCLFKWVQGDSATTQWYSYHVHQQSRTSAPFICARCGLTKTSQRRYQRNQRNHFPAHLMYRRGPDGPNTLCNACGIRFWKENLRKL